MVTSLGFLLVFESTSESGEDFRHQLILHIRIERSEFKDNIHVDDTPMEELQVDVMREGPSAKAQAKLPQLILTFFLSHPFGKATKDRLPEIPLGTKPKPFP